ncbi:hypothetical protein DFP72DRAFT_924081 [Ephemerocybe angulata]|uniref:BTB domain-containing protein n=1 Tax=Ephemerocybe angulata TaxID=980116 RepID=A0A8H6HF23_9AGAR|nr:hypothetical protein DFP72DRAFT_924081 [Tulosesus angulatus]
MLARHKVDAPASIPASTQGEGDVQRQPLCPSPECQLSVDVVLLSSCGALIGAHRKNLDDFGDGFPSDDSITDSTDPVKLTEDEETLKLLLLFMHKQIYPKVSSLSGDQLFALAEAAEKYMVFSAISACNVFIETNPKAFPVQSVFYGAKFEYPDIADAAAPFTIGKTLANIRAYANNSDTVVYAWLQYREAYIQVAERALTPTSTLHVAGREVPHVCKAWKKYLAATIPKLPRTTMNALSLFARGEFDLSVYEEHSDLECPPCRMLAKSWRSDVRDMLEEVPSFHTFL